MCPGVALCCWKSCWLQRSGWAQDKAFFNDCWLTDCLFRALVSCFGVQCWQPRVATKCSSGCRLPFVLKPKKRFVAFRVGNWLCLLHPWGLNVTLNDVDGQPLFEAEEGTAVQWVPPRGSLGSCAPTKAWQRRALSLESVYLTELRAWAARDERQAPQRSALPRADRFNRRDKTQGWPRALRAAKTKHRLNALVVEAASSCKCGSDIALILDGCEGNTCRALQQRKIRSLAPNVAPLTQKALEEWCTSWCGRIEDFLRLDLSSLGAVRLLYLDHTGSFASRASHIEAAFKSGILKPGSVLACTFSMRYSPVEDLASRRWLPRHWSRAGALFALVTAVDGCARAVGLEVMGIDLPGLNDYDLFDSKQVQASTHEMSATDWAAAALERDDVLSLAEAMCLWVKENRSDGLDWLRAAVAPAAFRVRDACGGQVLGCAWRGGGGDRGSPHCLLGGAAEVKDKDLAALRRAAARLRCGTAYRPCFGDGWEVSKADAPGTRAFHRSTMVYPEEMMFFMVKDVHDGYMLLPFRAFDVRLVTSAHLWMEKA
ncbi:unnamed protein product [Durusdinium trenchii]|uniref:Uncharacterized protein n=1 Tax=Durusdinium trenchii TaxID=1381693 RepID=A0ABP0PM47_9DINO